MRELLNDKRVLAILFGVFLLVIGSQVFAQDAVDVQQDIDIATVNTKADEAKGKANSLELRVTNLEALPTVDPTIEARVAALESAPPVEPYDDTLLAARVTALESQQATVPKWVARDSLGTFVADWFDRAAVGVSFITVNGIEIRFAVEPSRLNWIGIRPTQGITFWPNSTCGDDGTAPVLKAAGHSDPDLDPGDFFGGIIGGTVNTRPDGSQYVTTFDTATIVSITSYEKTFQPTGVQCTFRANGTDVHPSIYWFDLPVFVGPFTIAQE